MTFQIHRVSCVNLLSRVAQWLLYWAHNPKVPASEPGSAMHVRIRDLAPFLQSERAMPSGDLACELRETVWVGHDFALHLACAEASVCLNLYKANGIQGQGQEGLLQTTTVKKKNEEQEKRRKGK